MTPEELRALMAYLEDRVRLAPVAEEAATPVAITFQAPTAEEMIAAGLNAEGARRILRVPWWEEMVEDIEETPDMCDPDDSPQQVLEYAKDVVSEYVRKRFPLEEE
jgi:hypothetical protein